MSLLPDLIALIGLRAAGKSTLALALAARLGWPAIDTDAELAARAGRGVGELLAIAGEPAFRALEAEVCAAVLAAGPRRVVALGGGAVLAPATRTLLRRPGVLAVWVHAPMATLAARLLHDPQRRPPLTGLDPARELRAVARARLSLYREAARGRVNTKAANVDGCVARILAMMGATP